MKIMTVVGTRPEIIRLAMVIRRLDETEGIEHVLVHTGQNYDYELNQIFFDELRLRQPDHYLGVDTSTLGSVLGGVMVGTEAVLKKERPDAMLVLGDTNSCISVVMGKRMKIPTYHMEAGNRCFDENVPEETNRRLVDHVADFNLAYTEHARRNLLAEGLHPRRMIVTGSPMQEVLGAYRADIDSSDALERLRLEPKQYFLVSAHREENVDAPERRTYARIGVYPSSCLLTLGPVEILSRLISCFLKECSGFHHLVSATTTSCKPRLHAFFLIQAQLPKSLQFLAFLP